MKLFSSLWLFLLLVARVVAADAPASADRPSAPGAGGWKFVETRRIPAPEAHQGVASDGEFIFAIGDHVLGKYRKSTGERVGGWECPKGDPLIHMNAGVVFRGILYCAHSNFPGVPMMSSVELFDPATMQPAGSHSFGRTDGSLTWIDRHGDGWIACFVHYGKAGGEPGKGPEWARLVQFDDEWRQTGGWTFPAELVAKLGTRGYSFSGGAFGPEGKLFVTGHDDADLHVLEFPTGGTVLKWTATIPIAANGQAFGWDPRELGVFYSISRKGSDVIVGRVTHDGSK
jgi:outer membrane protein assembly factor BamB